MKAVDSKMWFLPRSPETKRILIHARSRVGLGHLNRSITIAQWLTKAIPELQVLFLIESGEDFIGPTGFPWIVMAGQGNEMETYEHILRMVLEVFRPNLMIYETFLLNSIYGPIREAGVKQALMGSLGTALRRRFQQDLPIVNDMDLVIILQQREEVLLADQELIARYQGRTIYAGPLVRQKKQISSDNLRQKLGLTPEEKIILLTMGGGGYELNKELLTNILAVQDCICEKHPRARLIVITGPHFTGELPEVGGFVCYASRFEPFFTDYLEIASVVVCMAGYSTVNEVAGSGIPAICVPTPESGDQVGRGSMSEYAQNFSNMVVSSTDKQELAQKVIEALGRERDLTVIREFWRRVENASQSIVGEIKRLLEVTA